MLEEPCKPDLALSSSSEEIWCVNTAGSYHCCSPSRRGLAECAGMQIQSSRAKPSETAPCDDNETVQQVPSAEGRGPGRWRTVVYGEWRNFSGGQLLLKRRGKLHLKTLTTVLSSEQKVSSESNEQETNNRQPEGQQQWGLEIVAGQRPTSDTEPPLVSVSPKGLPESGEGGDSLVNEEWIKKKKMLENASAVETSSPFSTTLLSSTTATKSREEFPTPTSIGKTILLEEEGVNATTTTPKYYEYKIEIVKSGNLPTTTHSSEMTTATISHASNEVVPPFPTPNPNADFGPLGTSLRKKILINGVDVPTENRNTHDSEGNPVLVVRPSGVVSTELKIRPHEAPEVKNDQKSTGAGNLVECSSS